MSISSGLATPFSWDGFTISKAPLVKFSPYEYDHAWLEQPEVFSFDPDLALAAGHPYPAAQRKNFGIFLDSAPDRWGRVLMQRRENVRARQEKRKPRVLTEWDFLLGVLW